MTTGRRAAPVPQLKCVGGTARGKYEPEVVQCYNRGFDGTDYQVGDSVDDMERDVRRFAVGMPR